MKWKGCAYWDDALGFYIPGDNVAKCIREGASATKKGKQADAGLVVDEAKIQVHGIPRKKTLEEYYNGDGAFILRCAIRIPPKTGARVMTNKCMIPSGWQLLFSVSFDERTISTESVVDAMTVAGNAKGLGGWRPKFGRFVVEIF